MCKSNRAIHSQLDKLAIRATQAPVGRGCADPLRMPRKLMVPVTMEKENGASRKLANLALALYEAGYIGEADSSLISTSQLVALGLKRVADRWLGSVHAVAELGISIAETIHAAEGFQSDEPIDPDDLWIGLEIGDAPEPVVVADLILKLESAVPGLGETTLATLEESTRKFGGIWSPATVRELASMFYWQGADTQELWEDILEEMGEDGEEYEMTPAEYDRSLGNLKWVLHSKSVLPPMRLVELLDHEDELVVDIAERLLIIQSMNAAGAELGTFAGFTLERESVYRCAFLCMNEYDVTRRVLDDHVNLANESSDAYTTMITLDLIPPSKDELAKWLRSYIEGLKLYKALDQLIARLAYVETGENP